MNLKQFTESVQVSGNIFDWLFADNEGEKVYKSLKTGQTEIKTAVLLTVIKFGKT